MNLYYIALVLPPQLNGQVLEWKTYFRDSYGCTVGLKSPAHITLIPPFWMPQELEGPLLAEVGLFASRQPSFELVTNGFSAFPPRTIFVALQPSEPLNRLKAALENLLVNDGRFGMKKENRPFHPHITLATRDLERQHFQEAWPLFAHRRYTAQWCVEDLSVLRHNRCTWDVWHQARFHQ